MHTTIPLVVASETREKRMPPTAQTYGELNAVYDYFNSSLFSGALPLCLITLQRKSRRVYGHYSSNRFCSNTKPGLTTDEIAMNPIHFQSGNVIEVLQTLAHEMAHKWQHHFGKPSRGGYHNREWAAKMMEIGLHPSSTGKPGGKIVGQHMVDYLIEGGPLARAIDFLIGNGFSLSWYDRGAAEVTPPSPAETEGQPQPSHSGVRVKYSCPRCRLNAWAKPKAELICAPCQLRMMPFPSAGSSKGCFDPPAKAVHDPTTQVRPAPNSAGLLTDLSRPTRQ